MKMSEAMVSLIFTFKNYFIKPFGFEKSVYGNVQYLVLPEISKNFLSWTKTYENENNMRIPKFLNMTW